MNTMSTDFIQRGYVILRGAVDTTTAQEEMRGHFPPDAKEPVQDFGSGENAVFPSTPALNAISVHPTLLAVVCDILGPNILLKQSVPWAKYGVSARDSSSNSDQRVHMDYGNNQWDMPMPKQVDAVAALVYYSDTSETGGATAIVAREGDNDPIYQWPYIHMPGIAGKEFINQRKEAEESMPEDSATIREQCYAREIVPTFRPGDVLLYRLDTWHRGTPVYPGKVRYVHNLLWAKDSSGIQQWNPGFTRAMYAGPFEHFISALEPYQLQTLGFPRPDDSRWRSSKFVKGVHMRYGWAGFDVMKYVHSAKLPPPKLPEFWVWSNLTFESTQNPFAFRKNTFEMFRAIGLHIQLKSAMWRYTLEAAEPYYISAECYFFSKGSTTKVDVNLLHGDRFTWADISQRVRQSLYGIPIRRVRTVQRTAVNGVSPRSLMHVGMDERFFDMFGPDTNPQELLCYLPQVSQNIRRCILRTLFYCETPFDVSIIEPYTCIKSHNILDEQVKHWANKIISKGRYVAHL